MTHSSDLQIILGECKIEYFRNRIMERRTAFFKSGEEVNNYFVDIVDGLFRTFTSLKDSEAVEDCRRKRAVVSGEQTLVLNDIQDDYFTLKSLCRDIGKTLGVSSYINAYITPENSQGFLPHYDSHDVIIVQLHGSKDWTVQNDLPQLVTKRAIQATFESCADNSMQIRLQKGNALYIPRGQIHAAKTGSQNSIHLTIGLYPVEISEVIAEMIQMSTYKSASFRKRIDISKGTRESFDEVCQRIQSVSKESITYEAYRSAIESIRRRLDI